MEVCLEALKNLVQEQASMIDELVGRVCTCGELGSHGLPIEIQDDEEGEDDCASTGAVGSGSYATPEDSNSPLPLVIRPLANRISGKLVMTKEEYEEYMAGVEDPTESVNPIDS